MKTAGEPPVFPYQIIWEDFREEPVSFKHLASNKEEYQILSDVAWKIDSKAPRLDKQQIHQMVSGLNLVKSAEETLEYKLILVGGYYLALKQRAVFQLDLFSSRDILIKAAASSEKLEQIIFRLPPKAAAVLEYVKSVEPDVIDRDGSFLNLAQTAHDFALSAKRFVHDTAPKQTGRRSQFIRDDAIRLTISALREAGLNKLTISRGTKQKPDWHFEGDLGVSVRDFFAIIEPGIQERAFAPIVDKVRRKTMKTTSTGK